MTKKVWKRQNCLRDGNWINSLHKYFKDVAQTIGYCIGKEHALTNKSLYKLKKCNENWKMLRNNNKLLLISGEY